MEWFKLKLIHNNSPAPPIKLLSISIYVDNVIQSKSKENNDMRMIFR